MLSGLNCPEFLSIFKTLVFIVAVCFIDRIELIICVTCQHLALGFLHFKCAQENRTF
jgi:hypothetical protein